MFLQILHLQMLPLCGRHLMADWFIEQQQQFAGHHGASQICQHLPGTDISVGRDRQAQIAPNQPLPPSSSKDLLAHPPWICCLKSPTCHPLVSSEMSLAPSSSPHTAMSSMHFTLTCTAVDRPNGTSAFLLVTSSVFVILKSWREQEVTEHRTFQNSPR